MARSSKQIAANRINGAKSRGPRKPAVKSGAQSDSLVIPALGESPARQRERLLARLGFYRPNTREEFELAVTIFREQIRQERIFAYENTFTEASIREAGGDVGQALLKCHKSLDRLSRLDTRAYNQGSKAEARFWEIHKTAAPRARAPLPNVPEHEKSQQPKNGLRHSN
jgi:hypothetical protein